MAANYIKKIRTAEGDKQIDYEALANKPNLSNYATKEDLTGASLGNISLYNHVVRIKVYSVGDSLSQYAHIDMPLTLTVPKITDTVDGGRQSIVSRLTYDFLNNGLIFAGTGMFVQATDNHAIVGLQYNRETDKTIVTLATTNDNGDTTTVSFKGASVVIDSISVILVNGGVVSSGGFN